MDKSTRKPPKMQATAARPTIPDFVEDAFQRAMRAEAITVEEFLARATWAYRATPEDLRYRACLRLISTPPDLLIEHERFDVPQVGTVPH